MLEAAHERIFDVVRFQKTKAAMLLSNNAPQGHGFLVSIWKDNNLLTGRKKMAFNVTNNEFARTPSTREAPRKRQKSQFDKQREEEVIRNAHERGFLRPLTSDSIWDSVGEKCHLEDIIYLNMTGICLHTVKTIDLCTRLRICVLHSNYISAFDSLFYCRELLFLDLHRNQVSCCPQMS